MRRREFITLFGSTALAWPCTAHAQAPKLPTIGFLNSATPDDCTPSIGAFRQGLSDAGYEERRNVALAFRFAEYHYDRLLALALALDLVSQGVDVIAATGGDYSIKAAIAATSTIPIVFTTGNDPVAAGYVKSLRQPPATLPASLSWGVSLKPSDLRYCTRSIQRRPQSPC
jgi:putative ABC transport system substrate-binding protein